MQLLVELDLCFKPSLADPVSNTHQCWARREPEKAKGGVGNGVALILCPLEGLHP
jgi:hypothetical protein